MCGGGELRGRREKHWLASSADESCLTLLVTIETVSERVRAREHQEAKAATEVESKKRLQTG